ncbi:MAG: nucleotidyltransferase family protein [Candidatus Hodarchaeales archaeon]
MSLQQRLLSKKEVFDKIIKHLPAIKQFGVVKIGIFGSILREEVYNDIDILVSFAENEESFQNLIDLYYYLEKLLNAKIDLVTTNAISSYIAPHILREVEYIEA